MLGISEACFDVCKVRLYLFNSDLDISLLLPCCYVTFPPAQAVSGRLSNISLISAQNLGLRADGKHCTKACSETPRCNNLAIISRRNSFLSPNMTRPPSSASFRWLTGDAPADRSTFPLAAVTLPLLMITLPFSMPPLAAAGEVFE